ncbi:MAG: RecQ family ATP-dependent DNA helicase, partial [Myxococcota bacterium]|nr:RecQ family ATP-dependent DNA helicase [Myxococcota bacterium]
MTDEQVDLRVANSEAIHEAIRKTWGHPELLPLQEDAIQARLEGRDSLVVLPTGGGKSLCYQVPPLLTGGTDVVVSPLIALMKDQVDGLRAAGYPAAALHSNLTSEESAAAEKELMTGQLRLIYLAPERLMMPRTIEMLARLPIRAVAVDEAHCISHWGHDFRPEYRMLAELRERIPDLSVHGFTATATPRVREDIAAQLRLRDPQVLIGTFDRPNLTYRVVPRVDTGRQVAQ